MKEITYGSIKDLQEAANQVGKDIVTWGPKYEGLNNYYRNIVIASAVPDEQGILRPTYNSATPLALFQIIRDQVPVLLSYEDYPVLRQQYENIPATVYGKEERPFPELNTLFSYALELLVDDNGNDTSLVVAVQGVKRK